MAKLMFYDVETTGTNYMKHSIIEIGAIIEIDDVEMERFEFKVRPHHKAAIDNSALAANGHNLEDLSSYPNMMSVHKRVKKILERYVNPFDTKDKFHLVGYNNRGFDDNFYRMMFSLCEDKFFGAYFWSDTIDVLSLASHFLMELRSGMPSFKLHRVAKTLGIKVDDSKLHEALYDVEITKEIYRKISPPSLY